MNNLTNKFLIIAVLGCLSLFLCMIVVSMQIIILHQQKQLRLNQKFRNTKSTTTTTSPTNIDDIIKDTDDDDDDDEDDMWDEDDDDDDDDDKTKIGSTKKKKKSKKKDDKINNSDPTSYETIHNYRKNNNNGNERPIHTSYKPTISESYWNQIYPYIQEWDATLDPLTNEFVSSNPPLVSPADNTPTKNTSHLIYSLQKAAELGHPLAQYYYGNSLASGIWPITLDETDFEYDTLNTINPNPRDTTNNILYVPQDIKALSSDDDTDDTSYDYNINNQTLHSYLLWRMAAMEGNYDASLSIGYRILHINNNDNTNIYAPGYNKDKKIINAKIKKLTNKQESYSKQEHVCYNALPYYEATAHSIIDQLEISPSSRGKINPPMDLHVLSQIHLHGGTSSLLSYDNKPDESLEALQYYHLRATSTKEPDLSAAYTLAHLYHYGLRGVTQNLTLALQYYEIAANNNHWEASGQAGKFYFWGLGMTSQERSLNKAYQYFRKGTPFGLEGCKERYAKSKRQAHKKIQKPQGPDDDPFNDDEEGKITTCDHPSLNGMGLLYLFGIPNLIDVDYDVARDYFLLSKQMGNMDASYNLAMMKLGYKENYYFDDDEEIELYYENLNGIVVDNEESDNNGFKKRVTRNDDDSVTISFQKDVLGEDPKKSNKSKKVGPNKLQYTSAISDLVIAANKGHTQARHKLAMFYTNGLVIDEKTGLDMSDPKVMKEMLLKQPQHPNHQKLIPTTIIQKDCNKALGHYKWIIENASPTLSQRTRKGYKSYIAGDYETSLRNYLAAAETGSEVGQVNAAFLLERGVCLNLNHIDCSRASVRLWKAAASNGNAEACLRVGDFYYYGRLRNNNNNNKSPSPPQQQQQSSSSDDYYNDDNYITNYNIPPVGPFFVNLMYLIYPEALIPQLSRHVHVTLNKLFYSNPSTSSTTDESSSTNDANTTTTTDDVIEGDGTASPTTNTCSDGDEQNADGTCSSPTSKKTKSSNDDDDNDNNDGGKDDDGVSSEDKDKKKKTSSSSTTDDQQQQQQDDDDSSSSSSKIDTKIENDLIMAAHYYRMAAEQHKSPRANFNLGFMYEWGLGLKQDFPLAKRHYDLAVANDASSKEADIPIQIALFFLNMHEKFIKLHVAFEEWWKHGSGSSGSSSNNDETGDNQESKENIAEEQREEGDVDRKEEEDVDDDDDDESDKVPPKTAAKFSTTIHVVDEGEEEEQTPIDILMKHLISWESILILFLTIILMKLFQKRHQTQLVQQQQIRQ